MQDSGCFSKDAAGHYFALWGPPPRGTPYVRLAMPSGTYHLVVCNGLAPKDKKKMRTIVSIVVKLLLFVRANSNAMKSHMWVFHKAY